MSNFWKHKYDFIGLGRKNDFIKRFSARMLEKVSDADEEFAKLQAEISYEHWDGEDSPEDACDEELSYWN